MKTRPLGLWASPILVFIITISLTTTLVHAQNQSQTGIRSPCPRAFKIDTNHQYRGSLHFICLQRRANSQAQLDVIQYSNRQPVVSIPISEMGTSQMASFVDDLGILRVLVAVPDRLNGTSMYSIDASGSFINETHTINTQLVSTMSIWRLELNWEWHLATANQPFVGRLMAESGARLIHEPIPDIRPMITIHSWRMSYFDKYQTINLPFDGYVNKLEPMHINDQEFLIVAMESYRHQQEGSTRSQNRSPRIDSIIYKLDFGDGNLNWAHYQYLGTKHAIDVSSFVITHQSSLQRDYYIALVGQADSASPQYQAADGLSNEHGLIIYKYLGDRFIRTHTIAVPGVNKIDTLSYGMGDNYVIIALMSGWSRQINLFLFDGLNLNPVPANSMPAMIAPAYPRPLPVGRYQRTLNSDSFRLFELPQTQMLNVVNTTVKRTLAENAPQTLTMPALVFSSMDSDDGDDTNADALYKLPIDEMIAQARPQTEGGYSKRDFIPQDLLGWCKSQISTILADKFEMSARELATLPRVDQDRPIEIHGNLVIEGNLHISNLLYVDKIEDVSVRNVAISHSPMDFAQTFEAIERAHLDIDTVKHRVDQILVDDGSVQEVYAPLRFDRVVFECTSIGRHQLAPFLGAMSCPQVGSVRAINLNGRDISNIQRQALLTGRSMRISQDIRFEHLVLRGRTSILDSLNGVRIDDIVFKQGHSTGPIIGHKNLLNSLYTSAHLLVDSWNGVRVDRQSFLTSSGEQRIEADLRFNHVIIDGVSSSNITSPSSRIEVLNGLHFQSHLEQIALSDEANVFDLPVAFDELIIQGPTHLGANSLLSSIDVEEVWRKAMFKHSHQNISAPMEFASDVHVSYGGDIFVDRLINGVLLRPDFVMMRNRNYDLPNPVIFEGNLNVRQLQVEQHLNGIQVLKNYETGREELALLYDGGNQLLTGDKILHEIHLGGHTSIAGTINGHLNLTQLYNLVRNNGRPFEFERVRIQGNDIRIADQASLHVSQLINGIQANDICMLANRLRQSTNVEQYKRLRFEQPIAFKSLRCASINGYNDLRRSFLMRHGQQHVRGTLRLMGGVIFNSTTNIRLTFNNLNVSSMSQAIEQVINESRTGHRDFYGDLQVDDLFAGSINELPLAQVFVAKSDLAQLVSAPMSFQHLDIENVLNIGQDLFMRTFNGLNVSDLMSNTLQYDAPQIIYNHVELDHLHILPGANLITQSINGHNLRRVYDDSVLIDLPQQILAPKTFAGQVDFVDRVLLRFGMDGLTESELRFILLLQSDELIEDDLEFSNDVTIWKSLEIQTGIINDVDVNAFVTSMLSEQRQGSGLRLLSNSSLRFKDVRLNNLVVTGTIQGFDLSREALQVGDNQNGTYNQRLRDQQIQLTNQQLFNHLQDGNQRGEFRVQTNYRNELYAGMCHLHSCPQTTPYIPMNVSPAPTPTLPRPAAIVAPKQQTPYVLEPWNRPYRPGTNRLPTSDAFVTMVQQMPVILPRPMNLLMSNTAQVQQLPVWRPQPQIVPLTNATHFKYDNNQAQLLPPPPPPPPSTHQFSQALVDPKYLEYLALMRAQAISELSTRVNKYLTASFYYEIVQKHPLLGPVLHAAPNPILNEEGNVWLLLKATVKKGEPCLQRGQKIDVMAERRHKANHPALFTVSSHIQETSNPSHVESLVVGKSHYLFISDIYPEGPSETVSQVLVFEWDYPLGMYNLKQRLFIDGSPTSLRAFVVNQVGCIALANPRVVQSNHSGAPLLYCQPAPQSDFSTRIVLPMHHIFDLDIVVLPASNQIVIAALAQQLTEQVGDLIVSSFDLATKSLRNIAIRRTARPLKLHFVRRPAALEPLLLVVSEGITSNDAALATTRLFALHFGVGREVHLLESQIIRDNQFTDIQSVALDSRHSMIFLQSTHSISIYAPLMSANLNITTANCDSQFNLIQRIPTKGANKFLAFNNNNNINEELGGAMPQSHTLVLSRDDCQQQKYSTLILKPKFR